MFPVLLIYVSALNVCLCGNKNFYINFLSGAIGAELQTHCKQQLIGEPPAHRNLTGIPLTFWFMALRISELIFEVEICTCWLHNESLCWAGSSVGTSEGNVNKNTEGVHRYLINTHCSSTCRKCLGLAVYNQPPPKRCKCSCLGCIRFSEVYMLEMSPVWSCHS